MCCAKIQPLKIQDNNKMCNITFLAPIMRRANKSIFEKKRDAN